MLPSCTPQSWYRLLLAGLLAVSTVPLHAQASAPMIDNSTMETDADNDGWPDGWPRPAAGGSWETENGNHFIRLESTSPGGTVHLDREITLPENTEAVEISWKQRVSNLKPGAQAGHEARIQMEFLDTTGRNLSPGMRVPAYRADSPGWEPKLGRIPVPTGARTFKLSPSLVQVESGTYDLDDIVIKPVAAPAVAAAAPAPAAPTSMATRSGAKRPKTSLPAKGNPPSESPEKQYWPPEIKVSGNRLVTVSGGQEVWLQGVNVPSLEWSIRGESIFRSIIVATEEWNANVIRLPVKGDHWFGRGKKHNTQKDGGKSYRDLVDDAITLAANRGAYVVLDLHHYRAPRKADLEFWTDAAARYKNHPAVIFDLLNEPHGISWEIWQKGGFVEEKKKKGDEDAFLTPEEKLHNKNGFQSPGMQAMLDTVRATGAKNVVVAGGLDYAYDLIGITEGHALTDSSGNGIMYASHVYPWKKSWQKKFLNAAAKHPILLGETGGDAKKMEFMSASSQENVETWVPAILGLIQKHRLNWTGWCFHPKASPRMLSDWNYTPTSFWGEPAKEAMNGKKFPPPSKLR